MDKLKVAAYCRVSTEKDDQVNSLYSQKKYFREYIEKNEDWDLVNIYADAGISGTSDDNRIAFKKMIADAKNHKINLILTKEISRFARNTVICLTHTRELKALGVGVFFINDNINTLDSDGELRLSIMASIAQEESRKTSDRVKWGQKRRMEQGIVFGRSMVGYDVKDGKITVNEEDAKIVKMIYHMFLDEGKGTSTIARELYEKGIKTKHGLKQWSNVVILRMLRNEKYVGDLNQKKTITLDFLNHKKKCNRGNEDMIYIKDHHEPIIDREIWNAAQEELTKRAPSDDIKKRYSNRYWCSGKIFCGICGNRFVSRSKKLKNGKQYKSWRCNESAIHGNSKIDKLGNQIGCSNTCINDEVLKQVIGWLLSDVAEHKQSIIDKVNSIITQLRVSSVPEDTVKLKRKIAEVTSKKEHVIDLVLDGTISKSDLKLMNAKYDSEIEQVERKIIESDRTNSTMQEQVDKYSKYVQNLDDLISSDQLSEDTYKRTVDKIVVFPKVDKNNFVDVYLNCSPIPFKVKFESTGRNLGNDKDFQYQIDCNIIGF